MSVLAESARDRGHDASDWIVTMHFYALCMLLRAIGQIRGQPIGDHMEARRWLNSEPDLLSVAMPYRKVEEWSRDARYGCRRFPQSDFHRLRGWFNDARDKMGSILRRDKSLTIPEIRSASPWDGLP
jgi:hypothetical protein